MTLPTISAGCSRRAGCPLRASSFGVSERTFAAMDISVYHALHELGVQIVVDEMGRGFASLDRLARAPIWGLQLDRAWVTALRVGCAGAQSLPRRHQRRGGARPHARSRPGSTMTPSATRCSASAAATEAATSTRRPAAADLTPSLCDARHNSAPETVSLARP